MPKRILILVCLLAVVGRAEYMTDYVLKSQAYGPWLMVEHHIYWWSVADTDLIHTEDYCDTAYDADPSRVFDTLWTPWIELGDGMDEYVCIFRVAEVETAHGADDNDTLCIYIQSTNDTISIDEPKSYTAADAVTDTTTLKFYAPADSFLTGSYTWGRFLRIWGTRAINIQPAACSTAQHRNTEGYSRTKVEFWVWGLDSR